VEVKVQGVPAIGIIDSGADITIINPELFKKVVAIAHLKKEDLTPPDKIPRTYDMRPFKLDGRIDLDISFEQHTMTTPVYLKMDSTTQLLLSEGVCQQLHILSYHSLITEKGALGHVGDPQT
jgi:hypothetical protein